MIYKNGALQDIFVKLLFIEFIGSPRRYPLLNRICRDEEAKIAINAGAFDTDAVTVYQVEERVLQDDFEDKSMLESLLMVRAMKYLQIVSNIWQ